MPAVGVPVVPRMPAPAAEAPVKVSFEVFDAAASGWALPFLSLGALVVRLVFFVLSKFMSVCTCTAAWFGPSAMAR